MREETEVQNFTLQQGMLKAFPTNSTAARVAHPAARAYSSRNRAPPSFSSLRRAIIALQVIPEDLLELGDLRSAQVEGLAVPIIAFARLEKGLAIEPRFAVTAATTPST